MDELWGMSQKLSTGNLMATANYRILSTVYDDQEKCNGLIFQPGDFNDKSGCLWRKWCQVHLWQSQLY